MRLRLTPAIALGLLTLVACGGSDKKADSTSASTTATTINLASRVMTFSGLSQAHTQDPVTYPQTPPVGGPHFPVWMNCGYYPQPVQSEMGVHSMEHGAAWITYRPSLPKAQVDMLRTLAGTPYVLVSPWKDEALPAPVVASAWGVQLKAESASDPAVKAFVATYANGPQTPEKGAPCTGGFGTPQS